jgi:regulatory protein
VEPSHGRSAPAGERRGDPAERLEHARAVAWRALNRRDRTELELRGILAEKRVGPEEANVVVGELLDGGFVDDASYAQRFADDRRRLDAWGSSRIERRLRELGVAAEHIAAAVGDQGHDDELEAALALVRRRFPTVPATPRERDRALGMLVRKGYELELAYDALRRYAGADPPLD